MRFFLVFLGFLALGSLGWAETGVVTDVSFLTLGEKALDGEASLGALTLGRLSFDMEGSREVKAQLAVDLRASDILTLTLYKAFLKARLDQLRFTAGKTRLTWGEGVMFNAGDVIFTDPKVQMDGDDLKDSTLWLSSLYWAWDTHSFLEALVLPPEYPLLAQTLYLSGNPAQPLPPALDKPWHTGAGARFYTRINDIKVEGGYLYSGALAQHRPYLSFQGALGETGVYLSSSLALDRDDPSSDQSLDSWAVTAGLHHQIAIGSGEEESGESTSQGTLGLRLEGEYYPGRLDGGAVLPYVRLFPEVSWRGGEWTFYLRSLVIPQEPSALTTLALQWSPLQGLRFLGSVGVQSGESGQTYSWENYQGWQATLGTRVVF